MPVWGDFTLIQFYPKLWQGSMFRSLHPWLTHMSMWHFWFWLNFAAWMNLFFIILFKVLTYQRADIRGTRSVGEKRRIAWPEMLIVIFPLFWAINIITNALAYLRVLEGSSGYVLLSVQVSAYQWGWKYCYHDSFYPKFHSNHILVGEQTVFAPGGVLRWEFRHKFVESFRSVNSDFHYYFKLFGREGKVKKYWEKFPGDLNGFRFIYDLNTVDNGDGLNLSSNVNKEIFFCRLWLKEAGIIDNEVKKPMKNKLWHGGYWITSQGIDANEPVFEDLHWNLKRSIVDPLRLYRSSGALVLPTRSTIRLMSCSEDITHSWAVPGLGFKMDCVPGRLFCLYTNIVREGIYFGQCSELCGWNHYNMPVVLYALPVEHFIVWWEIELHSVFNETQRLKRTVNFIQRERVVNYTLLNVKYK